jgi:HD-GYP domain-containing protein (c-di-GMP phosphodiesterase class II)
MLHETEIYNLAANFLSNDKTSKSDPHNFRQKISILEDLIQSHDLQLYRHLTGTMQLSVQLGKKFNLVHEQLFNLRISALLHDVGKLVIPDEILSKKGLSTSDWEVIKMHPQYSAKILQGFGFEEDIIHTCLFHHEKWDGSGYPYGISGEDIPILARILSVADVWEALNADRPYRKAWPKAKAVNLLKEGRGKHFDLVIVDQFLNIIE